MTATLLYRITAILLLLFAAGHTFGFLKFKPETADGLAVRDSMRTVFFQVGRRKFSYMGFYVGFGLFISVDLLFSSFLAWHMGSLARDNPAAIGSLGWAFCDVHVAGLLLSWRFFFPVTAVFSGVVAACLAWAAMPVP